MTLTATSSSVNTMDAKYPGLTTAEVRQLRRCDYAGNQIEAISDIDDPAARQKALAWVLEQHIGPLEAASAVQALPLRRLTEEQAVMILQLGASAQHLSSIDGILSNDDRAAVVQLVSEGLKATEAIRQVVEMGSYHRWHQSTFREVCRRLAPREVALFERLRVNVRTMRRIADIDDPADRQEVARLIQDGKTPEAALQEIGAATLALA